MGVIPFTRAIYFSKKATYAVDGLSFGLEGIPLEGFEQQAFSGWESAPRQPLEDLF